MFLRKAVKTKFFLSVPITFSKRNDRIQLMKKILWIILGVFATLFLLSVVWLYFDDLRLQEEFRRRKGLVQRPYVPQKVFLEKFTGLPIEESRYIKDVQAWQPIMGPFTNATLFEASPEEMEKIVARFSMPHSHKVNWREEQFPEYEIGIEKLVGCKHGNRYLDTTWNHCWREFTRAEMEDIIGKIELEDKNREFYYSVHLYYSPELSTAIVSIIAP